MLAYTYYTTETTRPTAKLTARNFQQVFENEFTLVKIQPIQINQRYDGAYYSPTRYGHISNISAVLRRENSRLFTLLAQLQLHECVHVPEAGDFSYLLFARCVRGDGSIYYKHALTSGDVDQLEELKTRVVGLNHAPVEQVDDDQDVPIVRAPRRRNNTQARVEQEVPEPIVQEVPEPIVQEVPPHRHNDIPARRNRGLARNKTTAPVEQVVPTKPKAIKFTMNTECYICMMDFSEDPDVTINSCCMKLAHTACYSGIVQKSSCACCRTTLE